MMLMPANLILYRLLTIVLSPLVLGHILWLSVKNRQSRYLWQRLGFLYSKLPVGALWFHCASVGEVITLLPLLKNLHSKKAGLKFIITTNTITGGSIVAQQQLDYLHHCYLPFDWNSSIRRFLDRLQPAALYVMETEIWPNLFSSCAQKKIPVTLINARLSRKTTSANRWIKSLLKYSLANVSAIYARSEQDAAAYIRLGADAAIVSTAGNLKLTTALVAAQPEKDASSMTARCLIKREYILLASSHQPEEKQVAAIWSSLHRPELLVIAPRHPQRAATIINQLDCTEIAVRSRHDDISSKTKIFLLDTIGELKYLFKDASLVIMGGSFVPVGGHNILEPAAYQRAIITGPYMENFREELELMLAKKAIVQLDSMAALAETISGLLDDAVYRRQLQDNTQKLSHDIEGLLERYSELLLSQLSKQPAGA